MMPLMAEPLPLPTLLSFALVAFTIEFDNEAEHRLPHATTRYGVGRNEASQGADSGTWLISMAMWLNCLRFVPEQGIAVRELVRLARTSTNWDGMRRWGYIRFAPDPADSRPKPPASALLVYPKMKGRRAQHILEPLIGEIEERWRRRFGEPVIDGLRRSLVAMARQLDPGLPDCMPILGYGLATDRNPSPKAAGKAGQARRKEPATTSTPLDEPALDKLSLPGLFARVLVAFALEFEQESEVSLAIGADVLRVTEDAGTAVRDLPARGGVSKEAVAMAVSFLTKRGYAKVLTEARAKVLLLTPVGVAARENYARLVRAMERRWAERYGRKNLDDLQSALDRIAGDGTAGNSPLFRGLEPYPEGWRARVPKPATLPHFPMVLHRGGWPDGS